MGEWSHSDPGFNQRGYSDSELEEDEANSNGFAEEQGHPPPRNPFIEDEAEVSLDAVGESAEPEVRPGYLRGGRPSHRC